MKKFKLTALICIIAAVLISHAAAISDNYTYGTDKQPYLEPDAYMPVGVINGSSLGISDFSNPSDVFAAPDGSVYIADTNNSRIVVVKPDSGRYRLIKTIDKFADGDKTETFNKPQGIFVTAAGDIYIADTDNGRVVRLDRNADFVKEYKNPPEVVALTDYVYRPVRVSVDVNGRLFIVSLNLNKGMIQLDPEGNFISFYGATRAPVNFAAALWRRILSQTQIDSGQQSLPTEYSANAIDSEGFVYGSITFDTTEARVRRLNPTGVDILRSNGIVPPVGDISTVRENDTEISSRMIDICVGSDGIYAMLDSQRGRVFVYDLDGNLLYIFGGIGEGMGKFKSARAVDTAENGSYFVSDNVLNCIVEFAPTEYALNINQAVKHQHNREYSAAEKQWEKVLDYSTNSELAFIGMGKSLYRLGSYEKAMEYFELGGDRALYSKAFKEYRRQLISENFSLIITVVLIIAAGIFVFRAFRKRRRRNV